MSERRRLFGPVNVIIPKPGISSGPEVIAQAPQEVARANTEVRKFFIKTNVSENSNGSSYLEVGNTIIEVSVFGPRPIRGSFIERASFSVSTKFLPHITQPNEAVFNTVNTSGRANNAAPRIGLSNIEQKISSYVETALLPSIILEKYPKSTIDVFITVISTDEASTSLSANNGALLNLISWIVNTSSLALVDSGIELKDIVTSGHARLSNGEIVLDPTQDEDNAVDCLVSYMNLRNDEIVGFWVEGDHNLEEAKLETLIDASNTVSQRIRANINSYLLQNLNE